VGAGGTDPGPGTERNTPLEHRLSRLLVWCGECDCYTADFFTHSCEAKRQQRADLANLGPARSERRRTARRDYAAYVADAARTRRVPT
jgi:hypothetical protein